MSDAKEGERPLTLGVYARTVGVILLCYSLIGFAEAIHTTLAGDFFRLGLGTFFLYLSVRFGKAKEWELRTLVGAIGVLTLLMVTPVVWWAYYFSLGHRPIEFTAMAVGLASILAATFLPVGQKRGGAAD